MDNHAVCSMHSYIHVRYNGNMTTRCRLITTVIEYNHNSNT